jgi:hypothetical protein
MPLKTARHRGISRIRLGLRVRNLAMKAQFRLPVSEAIFGVSFLMGGEDQAWT